MLNRSNIFVAIFKMCFTKFVMSSLFFSFVCCLSSWIFPSSVFSSPICLFLFILIYFGKSKVTRGHIVGVRMHLGGLFVLFCLCLLSFVFVFCFASRSSLKFNKF